MRSTQWSLVLRAGRGSAAALDQLCGVYWFPVYAYLRRVGHDTEDAREHTQEFFAGVLRRDDLARVTQEGGRFRDWLFVAVRRHHGRARAKARADKRQRIEVGDPEERLRRLAAPGLDPEQTFQRQWALAEEERLLPLLVPQSEELGQVPAQREQVAGLPMALIQVRALTGSSLHY